MHQPGISIAGVDPLKNLHADLGVVPKTGDFNTRKLIVCTRAGKLYHIAVHY